MKSTEARQKRDSHRIDVRSVEAGSVVGKDELRVQERRVDRRGRVQRSGKERKREFAHELLHSCWHVVDPGGAIEKA